jgi:hypothetical protein
MGIFRFRLFGGGDTIAKLSMPQIVIEKPAYSPTRPISESVLQHRLPGSRVGSNICWFIYLSVHISVGSVGFGRDGGVVCGTCIGTASMGPLTALKSLVSTDSMYIDTSVITWSAMLLPITAELAYITYRWPSIGRQISSSPITNRRLVIDRLLSIIANRLSIDSRPSPKSDQQSHPTSSNR